ncbi:30S ribosomal protein S6 [Rickettsia endosymbiont of Cardiosporidium cionae]|uniref:30S ribosomal protein S6 n=1 Tax=Rickettsia endosymbiont of Cardiosporidium cionae TaxID=2777155 RepID=UPI0018946FAE|nr:30S ribosomal protein S6 [Rickettsia endosymbiont of Cardiosporidium cionae]KAF8818126.1 hypothetical protein IHI24_000855 [Rickettsia endosymbiont of Cardiosporidium cionae]
MLNYELVIITRQDIVLSELNKLIESLVSFVIENSAKVTLKEYWGIRSLAYEINKNKKAHYHLLGLQLRNVDLLKNFIPKLRSNQDVIRYNLIRVNEINKSSLCVEDTNEGNEDNQNNGARSASKTSNK